MIEAIQQLTTWLALATDAVAVAVIGLAVVEALIRTLVLNARRLRTALNFFIQREIDSAQSRRTRLSRTDPSPDRRSWRAGSRLAASSQPPWQAVCCDEGMFRMVVTSPTWFQATRNAALI